jgi:hypothetical protein
VTFGRAASAASVPASQSQAGLPVDRDAGLGEEPAAGLRLLVDQDHLRAAASRRERRRETGGAGPDDQHVAVGEAAGVGVGIGPRGRGTEPGRAADERLVDLVPEGLRPHEGLVVEAGREQHVEAVVDRADVALERRPAVLARRAETLEDLGDRRPRVGLEAAPAAVGADERVRLLAAGRQDAARPVVLERAADEMDAVGEQRRRERVAGPADEGPAVEEEADGPRRIGAALAGDAEAVLRRLGGRRTTPVRGDGSHPSVRRELIILAHPGIRGWSGAAGPPCRSTRTCR